MAKKAPLYPDTLYVRRRMDVKDTPYEVGTVEDVCNGTSGPVARYKLVGTGVINLDPPYYVEGVDAKA